MRNQRGSRWSVWSEDSILSIGSKGSILSIGSVGSVLSVGSAGSILSVGAVGSAASAFSALSAGQHGLDALGAVPLVRHGMEVQPRGTAPRLRSEKAASRNHGRRARCAAEDASRSARRKASAMTPWPTTLACSFGPREAGAKSPPGITAGGPAKAAGDVRLDGGPDPGRDLRPGRRREGLHADHIAGPGGAE